MADPFLGEVKAVGFSFAPKGWAKCEGQHIDIEQNEPLYALLNTMYGGNGVTKFCLPDLRGRCILGAGIGTREQTVSQGTKSGHEYTTLNVNNIPKHSHYLENIRLNADKGDGNSSDPKGAILAKSKTDGDPAKVVTSYSKKTDYVKMAADSIAAKGTISSIGEGMAHNNMQPFTTINYIIAMEGIWPQRK